MYAYDEYMKDSMTEICMYVYDHDMMTNGFIEGSHNYYHDVYILYCLLCVIPLTERWSVQYITELWAHTPTDVSVELQVL